MPVIHQCAHLHPSPNGSFQFKQTEENILLQIFQEMKNHHRRRHMFHLYGYPVLAEKVNNEFDSNYSFQIVWVAVQVVDHLQVSLGIYKQHKYRQKCNSEILNCVPDKHIMKSSRLMQQYLGMWNNLLTRVVNNILAWYIYVS